MKNYTIILLHGWNQTKESMSCFEKIFTKYYEVLNINLLKLSKKNTYDFADYINDLHEQIKDKKNLILIGHSFGGKLASLYASKYEVEKLILIAPSTYIKKSLKVRLKIYFYKIFKCLKINKYFNSFQSNDYKILNGKEKETFNNIVKNIKKTELKNIISKTLIIGFKDDKQVNYKNLKYLKKLINGSTLTLYKGDHFAYFNYLEEISLQILEFIYD